MSTGVLRTLTLNFENLKLQNRIYPLTRSFKHGSCFFFKFNVVIWIPARAWIGQLVFQVGRLWRSVTNTIFPGSFESWLSVKFLCTKNAIVCVADYLLVKDVELIIMSSCCSIIFLFVKLQAMSQNHHRQHRQE